MVVSERCEGGGRGQRGAATRELARRISYIMLAWLWHLLKSAVDCVEIRMMRHVSEAVHVSCVDGLDVNTFYSQHVTISIRLAKVK